MMTSANGQKHVKTPLIMGKILDDVVHYKTMKLERDR